jgi:antitoxin (DNA-binding transcriptional repressor) of toxin-antitoxin stability system
MRRASVRELRTNFPVIEAWIKAGETVEITKRRRVIATLAGAGAKDGPDFAKRFGSPKPAAARARTLVDLLSGDRDA